MRNPILVIAVLVVLALVPIGGWLAMAASLDPAGLGRSIGKAILVLLSPLAIAGMLMIAGAVMLERTRRAGRIVATVGAAVAGAGALLLAAIWFGRAGRCVDGLNICTDNLVEFGAMLVLCARAFRNDRARVARAPARSSGRDLKHIATRIASRCPSRAKFLRRGAAL